MLESTKSLLAREVLLFFSTIEGVVSLLPHIHSSPSYSPLLPKAKGISNAWTHFVRMSVWIKNSTQRHDPNGQWPNFVSILAHFRPIFALVRLTTPTVKNQSPFESLRSRCPKLLPYLSTGSLTLPCLQKAHHIKL